MIWDAHCHLSDARVFSQRANILREAKAAGFGGFCLGGYEPSEWDRQKILKAECRPTGIEVRTSFGLHPWWLSQAPLAEVEAAWLKLVDELPDADALGETGLDFHPRFSAEMRERQREYFVRSLQLRAAVGAHRKGELPLVLHVVRAHSEVLAILKTHGSDRYFGLVHSFSGDWTIAGKYLDLGFLVSISGSFLRGGGHSLRETVQKLPLSALVLETDSPDQKPPGFESHSAPGWNDPTSIFRLADAVAEVRGESSQKILEVCSDNVIKLFPRGQNGIHATSV